MDKNQEIAQLSLTVIKASYDKGETDPNKKRRIVMTSSDTSPDSYDERMSPELFKDFTDRIENNIAIPEPFKSAVCEDGVWCGGMPYLSIAHYHAGKDAKNVPGTIESVYVDGKQLKSKAYLHDTPLGRKLFDSLCEDLEQYKSGTPKENPVRVSIGFLDLEHSHEVEGKTVTFTRKALGQICALCAEGVGGKIYKKGVLVHEAATRVPVNQRTDMSLEEKSMGEIITKKDDAASIIGNELAEELEQKSLADGVLVIKSEDLEAKVYAVRSAFYDKFSPPPQPYPYVVTVMEDSVICREGEKLYKATYSMDGTTVKFQEKKSWAEVEVGFLPKSRVLWNVENEPSIAKALEDVLAVKSETQKVLDEAKSYLEKLQAEKSVPVEETKMETAVEDKVVETPVEKVEEVAQEKSVVASSTLDVAFESLKSVIASAKNGDEVQAAFNALGQEVVKAYTPSAQETNAADIAAIVKSAVEAAMSPLQMEITQLKAQVSSGTNVQKNQIPVSRAIKPADLLLAKSASQANAPVRQLSQIEKLARRSVDPNLPID